MDTEEVIKRGLYDRGEFEKCLSEIEKELKSLDYPEKKELVAKELVALEGWCYYRKGKYKIARKKFKEAEVNSAKEGLAYLAAYIDKDDKTLQRLAQELGDRVTTQSALIIRARDKDSHLLTHEKIEEILERIPHFEATEVEVANLYHNAARFFYHKARSKEDLLTALDFFQKSLELYGSARNWHHRGAVYFWISRVKESISDIRGALEAARQSLDCWTEQMILDPFTTRHRRKWKIGVKYIRKLVRKQVLRKLVLRKLVLRILLS